MTDSPIHPKPKGLENDALQDAMWDLIDNGTTTLHPGNSAKWMYWLRRYAGFGDQEIEVKQDNDTAIIIGYKD